MENDDAAAYQARVDKRKASEQLTSEKAKQILGLLSGITMHEAYEALGKVKDKLNYAQGNLIV